MRAFQVLACCWLANAAALAADLPKVDALFRQWTQPGSPGAAVAVIQNGQVVYERGYGLANLEDHTPITPETIFHVASVSKEFTAMAIVLLQADGKLALDDDVHQYLPELPRYEAPVTLRQLLHHTSGIRDQWQLLGMAGWSMQDVITQEQILRVLFRQKSLNFPPGSRHLYSNGGFTLLAEVVRRVSGKPLPEFCRERIFAPLGMTHTHFHRDLDEIVPGRAQSYHPGKGGFLAAPLNYANVGATSLFTTPGDLARWLDNFRDPKVGGPAAIQALTQPAVLTNGQTVKYGLGLALMEFHGLAAYGHNGADAGYRAGVLWIPSRNLGVAVAANSAGFDANEACGFVAELFAPDLVPPKQDPSPQAASAPPVVQLAPSAFQRWAGLYQAEQPSGLFERYFVEGGRYYLRVTGDDRTELQPESSRVFQAPATGGKVTFSPGATRSADTAVEEIYGHTYRLHPVTWRPTDLAEFAGNYWSEELETRYTVIVRHGMLIAQHLRLGEIPLTPVSPDHFISDAWFTPKVRFERDAQHRVRAMVLGGNRITGVTFDRTSGP